MILSSILYFKKIDYFFYNHYTFIMCMILGYYTMIINIIYNLFNSCLRLFGFEQEKEKDDKEEPVKSESNGIFENFIDLEKLNNIQKLEENIILTCDGCNKNIKNSRYNQDKFIQHVAFGKSYCNDCWEFEGIKNKVHRVVFNYRGC